VLEINVQSILQHMVDTFYRIDPEGSFVFASPSVEKLTGYTVEELNATQFADLYVDKSQWQQFLQQVEGNDGQVVSYQAPLRHKDGKEVWVSTSASYYYDDNGKLAGIEGIIRNISTEHQAQAKLQKEPTTELPPKSIKISRNENPLCCNEEHYRSFVQNFRGIAFRGGMDFSVIFFHGRVEEITGYTEEEFVNGELRWDKVIHPQDLPALFGEDEEKLGSIPHFSYDREYRIVRKDGAVRWVHETIQNICDDLGKPTMVQGVISDITKRKQMEEALWESEEQLRLLVQSSEDIITLHSFDGTFLYYNGPSCYPLKPEYVVGKTPYDFFDHQSADRMVQQIKRISRTGQSATFESHLEWFGKKTWFSEYVYPVFNKNGDMVKVAKVCRNIDKIKHAQDEQQKLQAAISQAGNEWQQVFDSVSELIVMFDKDFRIIRINRSMCNKLDLEPAQYVGRYCCEIMHDINHAPESCLHVQTMADGHVHSREQYVERLGGWYTFSTVPVSDLKGKITATVMVAKDISDRKAYELELQEINENLEAQVAEQIREVQEHEQLLRSIFRASPICIGVVKNRIITYVNPMIEQVTGYSEDELCGQSARLLYPDEEEFDFVGREKYRQIQENGTGSVETRWQCKDGNIINVLLSSTLIDSQHPEAGSTYMALDITDRKQLENELRENNKRLATLINASPDSICFKDGEGRWLLANESNLQLYQLTGIDYEGKTDAELAQYSELHRDALLTCIETDEETWAKEELSRREKIIPTPDGEDRIFEIVKVPLFQADGSRQGLVVIGHDMTEILKTEQRLRQEIDARQQAAEILQEKSKETEDAIIALRVLLKQQNDIKADVQKSVLAQLEKAVFPYINLLHKSLLDDNSKEYLDIVSEHLHAVGTSFIKKLSSPELKLTKKEILVADLVRQGKNTKEIAKLLKLQPRSVETYRNKIRKKLNINNKKIVLSQYLSVTFTSEK
jgi:PAS domain S-box-containing protein